jgi:hypothetical protein
MTVNSITIVPYGSASLQGWGMVELAAGRVRTPVQRVGLAARYWGMGVGLAATVAELTG